MKSFVEFREGRYDNEAAIVAMQNEFRNHPDIQKLKKESDKLAKDGDEQGARALMAQIADRVRQRLEKARTNQSDPFNFNNANERNFKGGKTPEDEERYWKELDAVVDSYSQAGLTRHARGTSRWRAEKKGDRGDKSDLNPIAQDAKLNPTSTTDITLKQPNKPGSPNLRKITAKQGAAQAGTIEGNQWTATARMIAQQVAQDSLGELGSADKIEQRAKMKEIVQNIIKIGGEIGTKLSNRDPQGAAELKKQLTDKYGTFQRRFDANIKRGEKFKKGSESRATQTIHTPEAGTSQGSEVGGDPAQIRSKAAFAQGRGQGRSAAERLRISALSKGGLVQPTQTFAKQQRMVDIEMIKKQREEAQKKAEKEREKAQSQQSDRDKKIMKLSGGGAVKKKTVKVHTYSSFDD